MFAATSGYMREHSPHLVKLVFYRYIKWTPSGRRVSINCVCFFVHSEKIYHKTDDIFAFLNTLARRQIQCSLVQASIRMRWNVVNLGCTKAFGAIFRADFVEKTVARLKANRRNAIVINILLVINPNRTENSKVMVFLGHISISIHSRPNDQSHRQMSVEKISSNPSDFLCGAKIVVSVPLIILHVEGSPLLAFSQAVIVLRRIHFCILPNRAESPTPVYISYRPSCELFFYIQYRDEYLLKF